MARVWAEAITIGDLVDRAATREEGDAVVFPDGRATYAELAELTDRYARSLRALGVGPGEHVGILMPNRLQFVLALVGAAKLGAVAVPLNGRFKAHELAHVLSHADLTVLLTGSHPMADYPELVREALARRPAEKLREIVDLDDPAPFEALADSVPLAEVKTLQERVRVRGTALLMYTSGTTATPKGCLLTHEALVRHGAAVVPGWFRCTRDDVFWDALPLFHIGGITPLLGCLGAGTKFVHAGHFDPTVALAQLQDEGATIAYPAFDLIWLAVLDHPDYPSADLSRIRLLMSITTPERLRDLQQRMPHAVVVSSFGATECASHLTFPELEDPEDVRVNTLGRPLPGMELKVVNPETREEVEPGVVGELCLRGYARFESYYKEPELTAQVIDEDGWFYTGDLGSVDAEGRLRYSGRLKDMLKVGGENVAALEVEDYLVRHPAVAIVQVVGVRDARYGEVPAAFVQLAPGQTTTEEELVAFCLGKIATFKVPRYVRFVDEWPMSGTKIQKFKLREQLEAELDALGIAEAPKLDSRAGANA
jgi:fatty-acyl-CoA synthase